MKLDKGGLIKKGLLVLAILYIFLLSIDLMGAGFKLFGTGFAEGLISITSNPLLGLFIGILATSIIQSSSVSTSIIVGLTASGALTITNAIPIVMGANIGTSVTNFIVSLGHITNRDEFRKAFAVATVHDFFNIFVVLIFLPLEIAFHMLEKVGIFLTQFLLGSSANLAFSSPLKVILSPVSTFIITLFSNNVYLILGLALVALFCSLTFFVRAMRPLAETKFKHLVHDRIFKTPMRGLAIGAGVTALVQSSSVTTALLVPLAGVGIVQLERIFPFILGANVGTTITALLASLAAGSGAGVTIAIVHVLFNVGGSLLVYPMRKVPIALSQLLASTAKRSRIYPVAYVCCFFFVIPAVIIAIFH